MGDFGLGFGLYFSTLQALAFLFFAAGCLNIPNILFFAGKDYSNYQPGVKYLLKGSVSVIWLVFKMLVRSNRCFILSTPRSLLFYFEL
jgi:hypothetical protein